MNYIVKNVYGKTNGKKISVTVPGSKSITARALLIAAVAKGESTLYGAQFSDDCATFLNCLNKLGIKSEVNGTTVKILGCNGVLPEKNAEIYVGSAGTAARFIPALLAFQSGKYTLTCSDQMKKRPVKPLIDTLKALGARFEFHEKENSYPFTVYGTANPAEKAEVDITESSQFLSALLISAVCAGKRLKITARGSHGLDYVNMTVKMMRGFGATVKTEKPQKNLQKIGKIENKYVVFGNYGAKIYRVEPDFSAACYFYAMNKILGTRVFAEGVTENGLQGDYKFIKLLQNFDGGKIDMSEFSDQALTLAAIAPYFKSPTEIRGIEHIRRQECDRIAAIVYNLTEMGVKCEEFADGVKIFPSQPKPAKIKTFGDHRVAMSFAVTGLRADGIEIENCEVCAKTFANYFEILDETVKKMTE